MKLFMNFLKYLLVELNFYLFGNKGEIRELFNETAIINKNKLDSDFCNKAKKTIDQAIISSEELMWVDEGNSDFRIWGFEKIMPQIEDALNIQKKIKKIEDYGGLKVHDWLIMANKVQFTPDNKGSGGGFHRDSPFTRQVKYIWYLTDVDESNGPFCYQKGSNNYNLCDLVNKNFGETRFDWPNQGYISMCLPKGSEIICDTRSLHGGKPIKHGQRYALTLYTYTKKGGKKEMLKSLGIEFKGD